MPEQEMQQPLWAPWRMEYILGEKEKGCIFCNRVQMQNDRDNLILERGELCFVIMNRFPYNNGHVMVVPYRHTGDITVLNENEMCDVMAWLQKSVRALEIAFNPHGFNLGMNIGKVAGAGIDDHLHFHIVPRWEADTNFMPIVSRTKVVSEALFDSYDKIKAAFQEVLGKSA